MKGWESTNHEALLSAIDALHEARLSTLACCDVATRVECLRDLVCIKRDVLWLLAENASLKRELDRNPQP